MPIREVKSPVSSSSRPKGIGPGSNQPLTIKGVFHANLQRYGWGWQNLGFRGGLETVSRDTGERYGRAKVPAAQALVPRTT
jgi:hypothetical protein